MTFFHDRHPYAIAFVEMRGYRIAPLENAGAHRSRSMASEPARVFFAASLDVAFAEARAAWPRAQAWTCLGSEVAS